MSVQIRIDIFCDRCRMPMLHYKDHREMGNTEDADIPSIWNSEYFREYWEGPNQIGWSDDPDWQIWCDRCLERHKGELRYEDHAYCDECEVDLGEAERVKAPNKGNEDTWWSWLCDKCLAAQAAEEVEG